MDFQLVSDYRPRGDQGHAIQESSPDWLPANSTRPFSA